uniref:PAX-interacting protein 1 n=1 Tax=Steinernema glaseri TaxID=37863 RepID=A0A1I7Z1Y3_9BILA
MEGAVDGMSVHRTEDETMSPLESLDPHRLRDVVVDQHSMAAGGHIQRMQSMQCFQWSTSAIPALIHAAGQSPHRGHSRESNNSGSPAAQRRRLSSGSDSHSMQQHPHNGQPSSNFNEQQRTPINFSQNNEIHSPNARAAAMPIQSSQHTQQPLRMVPAGLPGMGPIGQQPQTPQNHVNPASQVNVSPSQNQNMFPNPQTPRSVAYPPVSSQATPSAQSQHTSYQFPASVGQVPGAQQPPQQQQQWMSPQQMQQHFAGQPRMFGNPAGQRVLVQRVQYPQGYNPAMTQAQPGYPPRPSRLPYPPPGNPSAPASQQPGGQPPQPPQRTPPVTSPPVAYPPAMQTKEQQQQAAQQQQTQQQQQQSMNGFVLPATQPVPPQTPQTPSGFSSALTNAFQPPPGASAQATLTPRTPQTPQVRPSLMNAVPQPPPQHITSPHSSRAWSLGIGAAPSSELPSVRGASKCCAYDIREEEEGTHTSARGHVALSVAAACCQ